MKDSATQAHAIDRNYLWVLLEPEEQLLLTMMQKLSVSEIFARILINRGIVDYDTAQTFLYPRLRTLLPNPYLLQDMDKAVSRLITALENREKITIFADYDVDGATSSALLYRYLQQLGFTTDIYVPDRLKEGYGPNANAMELIRANGTSLLVTVDCGTSAFEPLAHAKAIGLDVIVIDHHLAGTSLPEAVAIVNPNRLDDDFPVKKMAAVAVTYLFVIAVNKALRDKQWFSNHGVTEPNLLNFLDLVGLGTVCDVIPLDPLNRIFVQHCLRLLNQRNNVGLASLTDILRVDRELHVYHLGYLIGPRINAGGRCEQSNLGAQLLITDDPLKAMSIARRLDQLNKERRTIEGLAMEEAIQQIEENEPDRKSVILASGQGWHLGVLGILASKIKERYHKPAIIITLLDQELAKGSARSVHGFDIGAALQNAKNAGLLLDGGGHAMAGGFTIKADRIEEFRSYLESLLIDRHELYDKARELHIDAFVHISRLNKDLLNELNLIAPFGTGNRLPTFAVHARVGRIIPMKYPAIGVILEGDDNNNGVKAISFRNQEGRIGDLLKEYRGRNLCVVGTLQRNPISDDVNVIITDVAPEPQFIRKSSSHHI